MPASLIAVDRSDDLGTQLAFLIVKGVKRPPAPINVLNRLDPTVGMTYLSAGTLSLGVRKPVADLQGNLSIAVARGAIAELGARTNAVVARRFGWTRGSQPVMKPVPSSRRGPAR